VQLRRTNLDTGEVTQVLIPLEHEPSDHRPSPSEDQEFWLGLRARAQVRDQAQATGQDTAELDQAIAELDDELTATGIRGTLGRTTG